jgi:hypothetical protein
MCSWLVLLTACLLPTQVADAGAGARPKSTIVKLDEFEKEVDRLQKRALKLHEDADYLEAQLAKKKAEAESAKADVTLYRLTHDIEPVKPIPAPVTEPPVAPPIIDREASAEPLVPVPNRLDKIESLRVNLRGRVVDTHGQAIAGASVTITIKDSSNEKILKAIKTDANGDYSIVFPSQPANGFGPIEYEAPGHVRWRLSSDKHGTEQRRLIELEPGVSLGGSIVHQGQRIAGVKIQLAPVDQEAYMFLDDWTSISDEHGEFRFNDVPADFDGTLCFEADSLKHVGAIPPMKVRTGSPGASRVVVGPIEVGPARKVAGRVIFRDGMKVPAGTTLRMQGELSWLEQEAKLDAEGRFEVTGMYPGKWSLAILFPNHLYAPDGYRLSSENVSLDHSSAAYLTGMLDRDITDLTILFEPGLAWNFPGRPSSEEIPVNQVDLDTVTLTGVPASRISDPEKR